jgi:hypothetical protein
MTGGNSYGSLIRFPSINSQAESEKSETSIVAIATPYTDGDVQSVHSSGVQDSRS